MPRRKRCRWVAREPVCRVFKPAGRPACSLEEVALSVDELEAIRLADFEGLYQEQAAERMNVSRPTFGRIVSVARRKVAQALIEGRALCIEGGEVEIAPLRTFVCHDCGHTWREPYGTGRPEKCPSCGSRNMGRSQSECEDGPGRGRGGGRRRQRGNCS